MRYSKIIVSLLIVLLTVSFLSLSSIACTITMVGKNATKDGSIIIATSQDQPEYEMTLEYIPAKDHEPGSMRPVWDYPQKSRWSDVYGNPINAHGEDKLKAMIPEVPHTYAYTRRMFGVMNEHQLSTVMATLSGMNLSELLLNDHTKIRMTELTYLAMERATTAREALDVVTSIAEQLGFKSEEFPGKSIAIADKEEVWLLSMVEPGPFWTPESGEPGAIWVAQRLPDDHIGFVPNGFTIGVVDFDDPENFRYSSNLVSFAEEMGWYDSASGKPFSFVEAYSQNRYTGFAVATRQWRAYQLLAPHVELPDPDEAYGMTDEYGYHFRYPFSVQVDNKIGIEDVMTIYRDKFEGTKYDLTKGPLAGPFGSPNVTFGMTMKQDGEVLGHARACAADGTTYCQINVIRDWLPDAIGGVFWWLSGRGKTGFYVPFYCGINDLTSEHYTTGSQFEMEWGKTAYWAATFVNTFADVNHYSIIQDVQRKQAELEGIAIASIPVIDKIALELYEKDPLLAKRFLTDWCNDNANKTVEKYWDFANFLIVKYHNNFINIPRLSQAPPIPDREYWFNLGMEYQKEVRGRDLPEDYY